MVSKRARPSVTVESIRRRSLGGLGSPKPYHFAMPLDNRSDSMVSDEGSEAADDDIRSCCSSTQLSTRASRTLGTASAHGSSWFDECGDNCSISSAGSCCSLDLNAATTPIHVSCGGINGGVGSGGSGGSGGPSVPQTIPEQSSMSSVLQNSGGSENLHNDHPAVPLSTYHSLPAPASPRQTALDLPLAVPSAPLSWSEWTDYSAETAQSNRSINSTTTTTTKLVFTTTKRKHPMYMAIVTFLCISVYCYSKSNATLHTALESVKKLAFERSTALAQLRKVDSDVRKFRARLAELRIKDSRRRLQQGLLPFPEDDTKEHTKGVADDDPSDSLFNDLIESGAAYKPDKPFRSDSGRRRGGNHNHLPQQQVRHHKNTKNQQKSPRQAVQRMRLLRHHLQVGTKRVTSLQKFVQHISYRDAVQKYGLGKLFVELELDFPGDLDSASVDEGPKPNKIVIEMAPLNLMPHSVFVFLEMVHYRLFDGCSFILNALHVIKAAPLPYDGSSASAKVRSFVRKGLESVAFREYSPRYPHLVNTVGFAADGSPSFYINTQNNTDVHDGDPCFGTIVQGLDVVKRLEASPTRNGIWYKRRIGIKRAQIVT